MRTFAEWNEGRDGAGGGFFATPKLQYDRGLFRPQNWRPPVLPDTKKSRKIEILFKGKKKKKNESHKCPHKKPVVSFDFDGVLHRSMCPGSTNPLDHTTSDLDPFDLMHDLLCKEADGKKIIVVSKRSDEDQDVMWEFIKKHNLPVKELHTTNLGPKLPLLRKLGAIRHYDDSPDVADELDGTEIEFVLVRPH